MNLRTIKYWIDGGDLLKAKLIAIGMVNFDKSENQGSGIYEKKDIDYVLTRYGTRGLDRELLNYIAYFF